MQNSESVLESKVIKRVIAGKGIYRDEPILLITVQHPKREDLKIFIMEDEQEPMDVFNTFGDKINELKKQGYEVEYRFNNK